VDASWARAAGSEGQTGAGFGGVRIAGPDEGVHAEVR